MRQKCGIAAVVIALFLQPFAFAEEYDFATDPRPSVRAFAGPLSSLSSELKANPGKTKDDSPIKGYLDHLDFTILNQPGEFVQAFRQAAAEVVAFRAAAQSLQNYRPDKQLSPASTTSGTTSLVSKAGSSDLLSLALDAGALTRSVNGSTATTNGNLDGMVRALTGYSPLCVYPCPELGSKSLRWVDNHLLQPVTVSVATAVAQQSSSTAPAAGQASGTPATPLSSVAVPTSAGKLTSVVARYQILNKYDPHSASFTQKWKDAKKRENLTSALIKADDSILAVRDLVLKTATPLDREAIISAARRGDKELADSFDDYFQKQIKNFGADVSPAVTQAVQNIAASQQIWEKVREDAAGTLFTLEYSYNKPLDQPDTHDFKIVYGYAPGTVSGMLSLNGAFSIYDSLPAAAKYGRLHYGQVSGEYDRPFNVSGNPNLLTLSLAGYWQYQPNPSILNIPAGTVAPGTTIPIPNGTQEFVGTAGSLWVTQAKITIKEKSGISIPIGVKWSNKTDLLGRNKVGAQVGISYDFSSLSSLFAGNAPK
jgi:hypothetical protein